LIFNRNKDLTSVLAKIDETTKSHKNYKRTKGKVSETSISYVFGHGDDANREILLTVMVFEMPEAR